MTFREIKNKTGLFARWTLSRSFFVYVLFFLTAGAVVDVNLIWGNARIRSFNRLMPSLEGLAEFAAGRRILSAEEWRDYIEYYKRLVRLVPDDVGAHFFLGVCYAQAGFEKRALKHLRYAAENIQGVFFVDYNLGVILYNQGDYQGAIRCFQQAVDNGVERMFIYMSGAKIYQQIIFHFVQMDFDINISAFKHYERAHLLIAKSWFRLKEYTNALSVVEYALGKGYGSDPEFYHIAALSLVNLNRYQEALGLLTMVIEKFPSDLRSLEEIRTIFSELGLDEKAALIQRTKNHFEALGAREQDLFRKETHHLF